jgi:GntR family transcriptional regulator / MocR family aminotransferase
MSWQKGSGAGYVQCSLHRLLGADGREVGSCPPTGALERSTVMRVDEANWIAMNPEPGETLRVALRRTLRHAIRAGALREGVRLPASRVLAQQLGVSRGVVSDAYGQLEAEGFLITRERSAPTVAAVSPLPQARSHVKTSRPTPRYDLTPTTPDVTMFPLRRWRAAYHSAARRASWATFDYGEPRGERALREVLADVLGRTRGVIADPAQIVVVQGTAQGTDLLLRSLKARGATRIAVEDPSHTTQHERVRAYALELVAQPVDAEGVVVDGLDADGLILAPAHQFPTGCVLSGARRRALLRWVERSDALLIEDDYDAEFRYDREPIRALQGLAAERVIQLGTVSKTLAPALRLGWVIAPDALVDDLVRAKRLADDFSPALDQLALADLLASGEYDRHLRRARSVYRKRRDALVSSLATHLPELAVEGIAAGVHLLLRLPRGSDDTAIAMDAANARIVVHPLSRHYVNASEERGLVIGYGRLHQSAVDAATKALARIVRDHI